MSSEHDPLEGQLRELRPATPDLDRDATLYHMGRASAGRLRPWQAGTVLASLLAVGFAVAWWTTPPVEVVRVETVYVDRLVPVPAPAPAPTPGPMPTLGLLGQWDLPVEPRELSRMRRLEEQVLRHGLNGLSTLPLRPASPSPTQAEVLQDFGVFNPGEP